MSPHPDSAALEAFVLGHHDEIDPAAIEAHLGGCDDCLDEVGGQARLELLLGAAGREDAFASMLPARRRPRWPIAAAAAVAVAAAAALYLAWPSATKDDEIAIPEPRPAQTTPSAPAWARDIEPGTARCRGTSGDLTCSASSEIRPAREEAEVEAVDIASEALLEVAYLRGEPAVRAQRAVYRAARSSALPGSDRTRRIRHEIASRARLGRRDTWYWEEYGRRDGAGTEFRVYVRFVAREKEITQLLARYRSGIVEGAELVPIVPSVRWVLDPGDDMAWFVHRPGRLAEVGVRAGDILLHDQRQRAVDFRRRITSGLVRIWRDGQFR